MVAERSDVCLADSVGPFHCVKVSQSISGLFPYSKL